MKKSTLFKGLSISVWVVTDRKNSVLFCCCVSLTASFKEFI